MSEAQILANVQRYLRAHGSVWSAQLTAARFFWNRDLPLHEIEVSAADGRQGYLLVSESEKLPFVISKSFEGGLLSSLLRRRLAEIAPRVSLVASIHEDAFQYIVPFSFIAHMDDGSAIHLDEGLIVEGLVGGVDQAPPRGNLVEEGIGAEWAALGSGFQEWAILAETMWDSGPYYNQAYNASCVISGCSPVGWATYAAWLKGNAALLPNLFASSDCWYNDWGDHWPPCDQPTNECKDVDALIWWFNHALGTNTHGGTSAANIIHGSAVFAKFGSPQVVMRSVSAEIGSITGLLQNYAVLFCGVRDWQVGIDAPDKRGTLYDSPAGHSVVIHGIKGNEIYVNMGWGGWTKSRWFNLNSISQRQVFGLYKA